MRARHQRLPHRRGRAGDRLPGELAGPQQPGGDQLGAAPIVAGRDDQGGRDRLDVGRVDLEGGAPGRGHGAGDHRSAGAHGLDRRQAPPLDQRDVGQAAGPGVQAGEDRIGHHARQLDARRRGAAWHPIPVGPDHDRAATARAAGREPGVGRRSTGARFLRGSIVDTLSRYGPVDAERPQQRRPPRRRPPAAGGRLPRR